ncbi:PLDc N-terminal domain-containing protein [Lactococcus garvieae]|uniref:PLDc N-terminal domain-containing protein n=1 Tax=Lactococcus garvieae TaxID=1363 RepID=UPI0005B47881|nr:PLDc N-terminal domain-containing protein [Lactococcus garvieae]QPS71887.1 PLDc N-terminal domain-containing protein [Lactococcus garvieae]
MDIRIIIPLSFLGLIYLGMCVYSLAKIPQVKYLPKWAWAIICIVSVPLGGIFYFIFGRDTNE